MRPHFTVTGLFVLAFCALLCCGKNGAVEELAFPENYRSWKKPVKEILDYPVPGHGARTQVQVDAEMIDLSQGLHDERLSEAVGQAVDVHRLQTHG